MLPSMSATVRDMVDQLNSYIVSFKNRSLKVKLTIRWCISKCVDNCAASLMNRCKFMPCLWNDPSANYKSAAFLMKSKAKTG